MAQGTFNLERKITRYIAFTADKNGQPLAYVRYPRSPRWRRVGYDEAKMALSTGNAQEVAYAKWGK